MNDQQEQNFRNTIVNAVTNVSGFLKTIAHGPDAAGGKQAYYGVPKTLNDIAGTLVKIEQHLAKLAEK